jgi:hypothetical protein
MKSSEFVKRMREVIVLPNYYCYEKLFCKTDPKEVTDPVIKKKITLCNQLNEEQKKILFQIIRGVQVETLGTFFSLLDGDIKLQNQKGDFRLIIENDREFKSENLVDLYYELEQKEGGEW